MVVQGLAELFQLLVCTSIAGGIRQCMGSVDPVPA